MASRAADRPPCSGAALDQLQDLLLEAEDIAGFLIEFSAMLAQLLATDDTEVFRAVNLLRRRKAAAVASSVPRAEALEETQNRYRDCPCLTAMRKHTLVHASDVRADGRWPGHFAAGTDEGVASILGVPLDLGGEARAGLNIYFDRPHNFDPATIATVRHEVALASRGLRLAVRLARHREAEADLKAAMASRTTIDLAAGIIMGQNRCPQDEAFENLKAVSSHRNTKLRQVATGQIATVSCDPATTHFDV